ncbi:hypothetical protein RI129_006867 [Pyrocoelia pectoralis]|uniref:RING-CH-type domain-containing protein n=1 Tax=Pyrocoelia pectoralis TaxID=417401 RepID=A0AAN7VD76_9COLE
MSEQAKRNANHQPSQGQQKKVVVSIVLSESTTSELQLNLPLVEDFEGESSSQTVKPYARKTESSLYNLNKLFEGNNTLKQRRILTDTAYFSPKLTDSLSSLETAEDADDASKSSSDEKLKQVEIFTRPLLSFNSAAHEGSIDCERNNIYLSVLGRHESYEWLNICRICHGGESIGDLLSPCNCRGSIALAHMECLERWLRESTNSHCELCRYHYTIVRKPKYGIVKSVFVFILHPGDRFWNLIFDVIGFMIYTTATVFSTYTLSVLSTSATRATTYRFGSPQMIGFSSVLGIALIECVYTSWLLDSLNKHLLAWEAWYQTNCDLKVILSKSKQPVRYEVEDSE